jgi:FAD/FMN-containing dehydrogenase
MLARMRTIVSPTHTGIAAALQQEVAGTVVTPGDSGYDIARAVWSGVHDRRPAAIVRPRDAGDVAAVVGFAAGRGVELAIRGGGHGPAGHGTTEGGAVLDLSPLRSVAVDPRAGTAWAGAGLTAGELTAALAQHGLAVGFGDAAGVGIGGLTLGGGMGYLSRAHGLTIDNLLAAELVTADGGRLHVDDAAHPDLFWAIRGGGGNFGVATRFRYRWRPSRPAR